jgi:RND family efflux transporter MFP subunit
MKPFVANIVRVVPTLVIVAAAIAAGLWLWDRYMLQPWTRDGRVRADVINVAPDVSGFVSEVAVRDNAEVKKGDLLFRIDQQRFAIAVEKAEAAVLSSQATRDQAQRDQQRYDELVGVTSQQKIEEARATSLRAQADYQAAAAARDAAKLDLARADVHASANGIVSNLSLRPGDFVSAGRPALALVDTDSLRIEGYFEETKLPRIRIGAPAIITFPGQAVRIRGHVESIAGGIEDRERTDAAGALANVNPTFTWVRLAQRVPVRIAIDSVPDGVRLIAGTTATIEVQP